MPTLQDRMETLALLKETLSSQVNFYLGRKDWPKVTINRQALKACDERIATVRHQLVLAA